MADHPNTHNTHEGPVPTDVGVGDPQNKKFEFDVTGFIQSEGGRFIDRDDVTGNAIVESLQGERFEFDVNSFLTSEKMNPDEVQINWNTPDTALPDSPVDLLDRAFLAVGNVKGQVDFLSKRYDKVAVSETKGLTVMDQGVWKQVDPDQMAGNRYEISEAVADIVEFAAREALPIAGGIAGFAGGAAGTLGVGAVPAGIAGQVAGAGVRNALGAFIGTYQPEEGEILQDMGMETLYAAGGALIPVAGRTAVNALKATKTAFKTIGKKASEPVKEMIAETYGALAGTSAPAVKVMYDNVDDVVKIMRNAAKTGGASTEAIQDTIAKDQVKLLGETFAKAEAALPKKFGQALDEMFNIAEEGVIEVSKKGTRRLGFGPEGTRILPRTVEVDVGGVAGGAINDMFEAGIVKMGPKGRLVNLTPDEVGLRLENGLSSGATLDRKSLKSVQDVFDELLSMHRKGRMKGRPAARLLTGMNQRINAITRSAKKKLGEDPALARSLEILTGQYRKNMDKAFTGTELAKPWERAVGLYDEYARAVDIARKAGDSPEALEAAVAKLMTSPGKRIAFKGEVGRLQELVGGDAIERLQVMEAAKRFTPLRIKMGMLGIAGGAAAVAAGGLPVAAGAVLAIPRVALKVTAAAQNLARQTSSATYKATAGVVDLVKAIPKGGVDELLKNQVFWQNATRMIGEAQQFEQALSLQAQQGPVRAQQ